MFYEIRGNIEKFHEQKRRVLLDRHLKGKLSDEDFLKKLNRLSEINTIMNIQLQKMEDM